MSGMLALPESIVGPLATPCPAAQRHGTFLSCHRSTACLPTLPALQEARHPNISIICEKLT